MFIVRINIKWNKKKQNDYYNINEFYKIFEYNGKKCHWRITKDSDMEFFLGIYRDRLEALEDGKMLYFNILYNLHRYTQCQELGDKSYIKSEYSDFYECSLDEFYKNEEWFFYKKYITDTCYGLGVFEIDNGLDDFEKYHKSIKIKYKIVCNKPFNFLDKISNLDQSYKFSKKNQEIFGLISMSENSTEEIGILLLCQALEMMSENAERTDEEKEVIDELIATIEKSRLKITQKKSLKNYLASGKKNIK